MKSTQCLALLACVAAALLSETGMAQGWTSVLLNSGASGYGLAANASGDLFVCGWADDNSGVGGFVSGTTQADETAWSLSDSDDGEAFYDVGLDAQGNLYAVGHLSQGSQQYWYVKKSRDGGITWNTVDQYQYSPGFHRCIISIWP